WQDRGFWILLSGFESLRRNPFFSRKLGRFGAKRPVLPSGCRNSARRRELVEEPNGVAADGRREVRVAHRHGDVRVAEQLLDGLQGRAAHHEVRSERVTERVPAEEAKAGALARVPEGPAARAARVDGARGIGEDELAFEVAVRLERAHRLVGERGLPRSVVL